MSEIWIPPQERRLPNPNNPFDMAILLQQELQNIFFDAERDREAAFMLEMLDAAHKRDDTPEVTLVSGIAIFDSTESDDTGLICPEIGVSGSLTGFAYVRLGRICGLALQLDALQVFQPDTPDERDFAMTTVRTPIAAVRYVESH